MVWVPDLALRPDVLGPGHRRCRGPSRPTPWSRSSTRSSRGCCCRSWCCSASLVAAGRGRRRAGRRGRSLGSLRSRRRSDRVEPVRRRAAGDRPLAGAGRLRRRCPGWCSPRGGAGRTRRLPAALLAARCSSGQPERQRRARDGARRAGVRLVRGASVGADASPWSACVAAANAALARRRAAARRQTPRPTPPARGVFAGQRRRPAARARWPPWPRRHLERRGRAGDPRRAAWPWLRPGRAGRAGRGPGSVVAAATVRRDRVALVVVLGRRAGRWPCVELGGARRHRLARRARARRRPAAGRVAAARAVRRR